MTTTYLDRLQGIETSVAVKAPVLVATTAAITLSGEQTIDGVALVAGDRVLVKDQVSAIDNGIWDVSTGAWSRSDDFNGTRDAVKGTRVYVVSGSANSNTEWVLTTTTPEVGVSSLAFIASGFSVTSIYDGPSFDAVADMIADATMTYTTGSAFTVASGDQVRAGIYLYDVAASGATDHHLTTAGGVKLYVLPHNGTYHVDAFGADTATDTGPVVQAALAAANAFGGSTVRMGHGPYSFGTGVTVDFPCWIICDEAYTEITVPNPAPTSVFTFDTTYGGFRNGKFALTSTGNRGITIGPSAVASGDLRFEKITFELGQYHIYNDGGAGFRIENCQSTGASVRGFYSKQYGMNARIKDTHVFTFQADVGASACEIAELDTGGLNTEGLVIDNCRFVSPGGSPLIVKEGLYIEISKSILSEGALPVLIDSSDGGSVNRLRIDGCYIQAKSAYGATKSLEIGGNVADLVLSFNNIIYDAATKALDITGAVNRLTVIGNTFRTAEATTAGSYAVTVGPVIAGRWIGNTFRGIGGSGKNILEDANATNIWAFNDFNQLVDPADRSPKSHFLFNYGDGVSQTTADGQFFVPNGTAALPALAFDRQRTHGLFYTAGRVAVAVSGAEVGSFDATGVRIAKDFALHGDSVTLAANAATSFTPANTRGIVTISTNEGACEFHYRTSPSICQIATANPPTGFAATTGVLGGTTGTTSTVTVSAHTDGKIYVENRQGGSRTIQIAVRY